MKDWIVKKLLAWVLAGLTKEQVEAWAAAALAYVVPWVRSVKDQVVAQAKAAINAKPDDYDAALLAAVDAFDNFMEALLPDNPNQLKAKKS